MIQGIMIRAACFLICAVASASCAAPLPERPTLCQLAGAQEDYVGRELTVEGYLFLSGHGNDIVEPTCRGAGVAVSWDWNRPQLQPFFSFLRGIDYFEPWVIRVRATGVMMRGEGRGDYAIRFHLRLNTADVLDAWKVPEAQVERFSMWSQGFGPAPVRPRR